MTVKVFINGFGRIGRNVLRAIVESGRTDIQVVGINDLGPVETNAHLMRYDSVHGRFPGVVKVDGDTIDVGTGPIKVTAIKDPGGPAARPSSASTSRMECTGIFTARDKAATLLDRRRQARAGLRALRRRRPDRRLWRQPRQADQGSSGRLQRLLHHQLPRAGRQGRSMTPSASKRAS